MTNLDLTTLTLDKGAHNNRDDGVCLLEAVAWWAGEEHDDAPACVSPILAAYGRSLNDVLPDGRRQELRQFIPQMPGTRDDLDETRGYLALDWLVRTYTPAWLDLAGLTVEAAALRDLRRIVDLAAAQAAGPVVRSGAESARAARAAARDAARDAARAAARAAAWAAARAAAWAAARAAARAAAWAAARDAARAAAGDAAWAAARAAAWAAAWAAAGDAARAAARDAARAAAGDAAWERLAPTVDQLQTSAIELLGQMIRPEVTR
nr:hypothetical protein [Micromonospora sp. DSM 115978]